MLDWTNKYISIPFLEHGRDHAGVDCWGLVRLVFKEQFGVDVESYDDEYISTCENEKLADIVERERGMWWSVAPENVRCGDVVLLAIIGYPCHVGIAVGDGMMLNARSGVGVALESYERPYWSRRLRGFYRHGDMWIWMTTGVPSFEFRETEPCYR